MPTKFRLDLTELNAKAANFNLLIDSAKIFEIAVGQSPSAITGSIKPSLRIAAEWIDDKSLAVIPVAEGSRAQLRLRRRKSRRQRSTGTGWRCELSR
jgi:hypothetical protein